MLEQFREQKKAILSMDFERKQKEAGLFSAPKRPKMHGMDSIPMDLPAMTTDDFVLLKRICAILKIFDTEWNESEMKMYEEWNENVSEK